MSRVARGAVLAAALAWVAGCAALLDLNDPGYATAGDAAPGDAAPDDAAPPDGGPGAEGGPGASDGGADVDAAIPCPATPDKTVVYVDPVQGDDTASGTCLAPRKTIAAAVVLVASNPATFKTIALQPGTYAQDTNGETFPVVVPPGVTMHGPSPDAVTIRGGAVVGDSGDHCGVLLTNAQVLLRDVTITGKGANGMCVGAPLTTLLRVKVLQGDQGGILLGGIASVDIQDSAIAFNQTFGIFMAQQTQAKLKNVDVAHNSSRGVAVLENSQLTSTNSRFTSNAVGITCLHNAQVVSSNDTVSSNVAHGLELGDGDAGALAVSVTNDTFDSNGGSGITVDFGKLLARGSTFTNNGRSGVLAQGYLANGVDLGSGSTGAGGNHFSGNVNAGICVDLRLPDAGPAPPLAAEGNHFSACPPTSDTKSCSRTDLGATSAVTILTASCLTP
jgi:hypothetical protein